jgi:hypothetical protein
VSTKTEDHHGRLVFFLGGHDLEMITIRAVIEDVAPGSVRDASLPWGATTDAYEDEIVATLQDGRTPVLVELLTSPRASWAPSAVLATTLSPGRPIPPGVVVLADHHGESAGAHKPTSLEQVMQLLGIADRFANDRWLQLVAANDRGYVDEMARLPATIDEMRRVRTADRAAQGITSSEEAEGEIAVARARRIGATLTVVDLAHDRAATVTDRLDATLGGPGFKRLLVRTPVAAHVFADGDTIDALRASFPAGWFGGALPDRGFWGREGDGAEIEAFLSGRECASP